MSVEDDPLYDPEMLRPIDFAALAGPDDEGHPPRILLLYGSLRPQSYSRASAEEGARVLRALGCEIKIFDPIDLPLPDSVPDTHPKVQELRSLALWSEGMVWSSPERHGAMTGILKTQIDWIPLSAIGGVRPTQGKTLGADAGLGWLAVVQRGQSNADPGPLDADDHNPQSKLFAQGLARV